MRSRHCLKREPKENEVEDGNSDSGIGISEDEARHDKSDNRPCAFRELPGPQRAYQR